MYAAQAIAVNSRESARWLGLARSGAMISGAIALSSSALGAAGLEAGLAATDEEPADALASLPSSSPLGWACGVRTLFTARPDPG
jgi:hypothetical protein